MSKRSIVIAVAFSSAWIRAAGSEKIRVNQTGYSASERKIAVSLDASATEGTLVDSATGAEAFRGPLGATKNWAESGENARVFEFTSFAKPGAYMVKIGSETSHPFRVQPNPFREVTKAAVKAFWYNRCSYALPAAQAGAWARSAGHPDNNVVVHASAATSKRPTNSTIKSPGGWYDAGDYGKYVVNSGISTWTLLRLYELHASHFDTLRLGVPTHGGHRSDLVDEALYNVRWMLTMQDPDDGGVYHKLTTANFSGFVMPSADNSTRYVVMKSTAAALDLAAVAATSARIFRGVSSLPGFSDSCLTVALKAWRWARANPSVLFNQGTMNSRFSPGINTGEYGDSRVGDEFAWAASELMLATGADSFATAGNLASRMNDANNWIWPGCTDVAVLGWISLLGHADLVPSGFSSSLGALKTKFLKVADSIREYRDMNPYQIPRGGFWWGGNSTFANNGMLLWEAWRVSGDSVYRKASLDVLDYLLGRNATGYCFVTGLGSKSPKAPHHRPSGADGVAAPVPGFLVGGCNGGQEDKSQCSYPTTLPARSYVDNQNCYAVNEVAINWNAPLAYLAGVWSATMDAPRPSSARGGAVREGWGLELRRFGARIEAATVGRNLTSLEILSLDGRVLARSESGFASVDVPVGLSGVVVARARAAEGMVGERTFLAR